MRYHLRQQEWIQVLYAIQEDLSKELLLYLLCIHHLLFLKINYKMIFECN